MHARLQKLREARKDASGFTLIELLIVIIILGVLAGIVVFAVSGINDTSKLSACKADYKNVEIASEAYYANANPHAYAAPAGVTGEDNLVSGGFLREATSDDNYQIRYGANGVVTVPVQPAGLSAGQHCGP